MPKKEETPIKDKTQVELQQKVGALLNARREATGAYKSSIQNLISSIDNLFKIDDSILTLFISPKVE